MASSLSACCGSVTSAATALPSASCSSSPVSSAAQCQLASLNRRRSSSAECLSTTSRNVLLSQRGIRHKEPIKKYHPGTVCAATNDLAAGVANTKVAPLAIRDAKIVAQPLQDNQLKIRVDVDGPATKRAFDAVLKDLARNAPPVPGFRKAKGGKTSIVPLNVIYQLMGPRLVRKFVIEEIIKATLNDYVQKEDIKVKNELKTDQSSDALDADFEPGKDFGFDATLDLATDEAKPDSDKVEEGGEVVENEPQPLEAGV